MENVSLTNMPRNLYITLDLESDYAGIIPERYEACDLKKLKSFFEVINKYNIKLNIFIVGKMLEDPLPIINKFIEYGANFQLHSYSHNLKIGSTLSEIKKGKKAYFDFFGKYPIGYRAPQGRILDTEIKNLDKEGFKFDTSIFPSFWPSIKYIFKPRKSYKIKNTNIIEYPIATTPFRMIISQSWINLLGWKFYKNILNITRPLNDFVYDLHLHDFVKTSQSYNELPRLWKLIYKNPDSEAKKFEQFILFMKKKGYLSKYLNEAS